MLRSELKSQFHTVYTAFCFSLTSSKFENRFSPALVRIKPILCLLLAMSYQFVCRYCNCIIIVANIFIIIVANITAYD